MAHMRLIEDALLRAWPVRDEVVRVHDSNMNFRLRLEIKRYVTSQFEWDATPPIIPEAFVKLSLPREISVRIRVSDENFVPLFPTRDDYTYGVPDAVMAELWRWLNKAYVYPGLYWCMTGNLPDECVMCRALLKNIKTYITHSNPERPEPGKVYGGWLDFRFSMSMGTSDRMDDLITAFEGRDLQLTWLEYQ
jgi:hypothetical protein